MEATCCYVAVSRKRTNVEEKWKKKQKKSNVTKYNRLNWNSDDVIKIY